MAVVLKQREEKYEIDGEKEAEDFIAKMKSEHHVTKTQMEEKYLKKDERLFYNVLIRMTYDEE